MATVVLHHPNLNASFQGVQAGSASLKVIKFTGIKYGHIPARFAKAQPISPNELVGKVINASKYGPRCPQIGIDVRCLLRIPEEYIIGNELEDEFECLNLDVTMPSHPDPNQRLPVFIWIHGGSQAITFCSAASGICDPTRLVVDSLVSGKPFIAVALNYRLNILGFGDSSANGDFNLSLSDQALAINWVRNNISGFGGDPENITLCGESAGATFVHAHLITGPPVKRAILMSGSLHLSPPMPHSLGKGLLQACEERAQQLEGKTLRGCSQTTLKQIITEQNVSRCWLQEAHGLANWETKQEQVEELIIGDVEFESAIWKQGIEALPHSEIVSIFPDTHQGAKLRQAYCISKSRPASSRQGALDFVHDMKHSIPIELLCDKLTANNKPVYRYVLDEVNPWQSSSRAHHAVDLIFLFGGVDISHKPTAERTGSVMRNRWITFIHGEVPWGAVATGSRLALGPYGEVKEIGEEGYAARRRVHTLKLLRETGIGLCAEIANKLVVGRMSLLN